jgi:hypothetical protein
MRRTLMSALIATLAPNAAFSDELPSFPMFICPINPHAKACCGRAGYRGGCRMPAHAVSRMIAAEDGQRC